MLKLESLQVHERPLITGATAVYKYSKALENKFKGVSRFDDPINLATVRGDYIHLPRAVCPLGEVDKRQDGHKVEFPGLNFKPRTAEQARFVEQVVKHLKNGDSLIARAYTGFGKTALACPVIAAVQRQAMIVVPKQDLIQRWCEDLVGILGLKPSEIGLVQQDKFSLVGKKVVVGMLHSLIIEGRYPEWLYTSPGLIVFDEVHRLGAETFSRAASKFTAKLRLGLSATVQRSDGKDVVIMAHIGPIRVSTAEAIIKPKVLRFDTGWQCPQYKDRATGKMKIVPHSAGKAGHILKAMVGSNPRNHLLAVCVAKAYKAGRKTVFFSDMLAHLDEVRLMAVGLGVPMAATAYYTGGMKEAALEKASVAPVIFATYKMMSEGTNIPWLDTAILGTPKSGVEQIIGRILREYPDKKEPVVFDPVDLSSPVYAGYSKARARWYSKVGAKVVHINLTRT